MFAKAPFVLNSTTRWLRLTALAPVLFFNSYTWAIPVPDRQEIDASTPVQAYNVSGTGNLISNGATTLQISTLAGAGLTLNGTTTNASGSTIAISLADTVANISGSTILATGGTGLNLGTEGTTGPGSVATVSGSTITGGPIGINAGARSTLTLQNSTVTGTSSGSRGIIIFDAVVSATGSTITGQQNGVLMRAGSAGTQPARLSLDSTHVEAIDGPAILIGTAPNAPTTAILNISNGSTLKGGNGNILEVVASSTAQVNVDSSQLAGNILVGAGSTANTDWNRSSLTGNIVADSGGIANAQFNSSSQTGDVVASAGSTASLILNDSNLNGNVSVDGSSTASLDANRSVLAGDVIAQAGGIANVTLNGSQLTGRLVNANDVTFNNGSQWVMTGDSNVQNLSINGSSIKFGDAAAFYRLSVENLSGNGTFIMDSDFTGARTDFLDITGTATGNHSLLIGSTGTDPAGDASLHVVHAAAGDASFALVGGTVDRGTWSYDLVKQGANDWYLDAATKTVSPGTRTVLALFNTAPTVWYGELSSLRSRMGELRLNDGSSGGWLRTYGNKFNVADASGFGYKQVQQGVSLGADGKLPIGDGHWLAGVMAGQSKSDLDLDRGTNGKVDSYYVGAYSTWLDPDSGYYFDGVLKFNRFQNKAKVNLSDGTRTKGDYDNSGVGASLEFGRHIKLDNDYFVEPYTQLSGVIIQGKDYQLDNGMRAEGDRTRSLLGKAGATFGRNFDLGQGRTVQPYVRAAAVHEFAKNNDVQVNGNVFNNDLSGSRGELGTGIAVALSDKLAVHADFEYSNGDKIEQPWGANVGLRYNW